MFKIRVYGDKDILSALPNDMARHSVEGEMPDAVLVMPGQTVDEPLEAPTVIAPSECRAKTKQFITYGAGPKDTVTFSSVSGDYQILALQREIVTLGGVRLERQDIPLPPNNRPHRTLALCALMLTTGVEPASMAESVETQSEPRK